MVFIAGVHGSGTSLLHELDLSEFADDDGIAESSVIFSHGEEVWVALARVDRTDGWTPVESAELLLINASATPPELVDLDEQSEGVQGIRLPSIGIRQVRVDPRDPDRVYLLGNGIATVDLQARTAQWAVTDDQMAQAGLDNQLLPQSFDITDDAKTFILAAYRPDFSGVDIYEVPTSGGVPTSLVDGLNAVERTLEVIGDEIWFGDTTVGGSGLRGFELDGTALLDSPLSTGLDPYAVAEL